MVDLTSWPCLIAGRGSELPQGALVRCSHQTSGVSRWTNQENHPQTRWEILPLPPLCSWKETIRVVVMKGVFLSACKQKSQRRTLSEKLGWWSSGSVWPRRGTLCWCRRQAAASLELLLTGEERNTKPHNRFWLFLTNYNHLLVGLHLQGWKLTFLSSSWI